MVPTLLLDTSLWGLCFFEKVFLFVLVHWDFLACSARTFKKICAVRRSLYGTVTGNRRCEILKFLEPCYGW